MRKKIHCIVQCRLSSSRLPAKIFLPGPNKPLIDHLIERLNFSKNIDKIILAIPKSDKNNFINDYFNKKISLYRGDEFNVLKRYFYCAKNFKSDIIIRITSDCPLMDFRIIDEMIKKFLDDDCDYLSNVHPPSYPDGFDVEIFTFNALKKAYKSAKKNFQKEHVTPYIWDNPKLFKVSNYWPIYIKNTLHNSYRLTLDYLEDFILISKIYKGLYKKNKKFSFFDIMNYLKKNPKDIKLNKKLIKVNWYGLYIDKLKTIKKSDTRKISNQK